MFRLQRNLHMYHACLAIFVFVLNACNAEDKGFAGSGGGSVNVSRPKPKIPEKDKVVAQPDPPVEPLPPSCMEAKLNSVKSLTSFVDQRNGNSIISLELTFIPCPSQMGTLQLPILFDVDAETFESNQNDQRLSYEISVIGGGTSGSGFLNHIEGNDLFGKVGKNYGHYQSDGAIGVSTSISKATMTIRFRDTYVLEPIASRGSNSNFSVPMYVKIGKATPVKVNVTFTPPGEAA